ncbi:transglycosylase family protein [Streptomyces luteocolor]|uniref:transglycosylase family protein n=1 Tax=Streptomyces luteocolor TaxID=285500 RepID=UPI000853AC7A|nr:transglycosylase family protein [Streptomyces luteocolor]
MLSGHGRHRRPRQAPALIVAAGVTGSAIAIPLLGATSASAAETTTWEKLAECESGGAWSADPGNGYYGGLQLSQEMWEKYGGLSYAPSADQASRSQQIAVAEQILDDQGTAAWPSCAPIAGLTQDGAAADVDPGAPVTPEPSDSADPSGSGDAKDSEGSKDSKDSEDSGKKDKEKGSEDSTSPEGSREADEPSDSADPSDDASDTPGEGDASRDKNHDESGDKRDTGKKGDKGESDGTDKSGRDEATSPGSEDATEPSEGAGRHRGDRADEGPAEGAEGAEGDRAGRHASRGGDRTDEVAGGTYTVRSGDSLSVIADDLDVAGGWHELYSENKKTVGGDPDLILPGQSLDLGEK